jgi:hypothetical protein
MDASRQLKLCPYCSEEIPANARKCTYCGFIIPANVHASPSARKPGQVNGDGKRGTFILLATLVLWIAGMIVIRIIAAERARARASR